MSEIGLHKLIGTLPKISTIKPKHSICYMSEHGNAPLRDYYKQEMCTVVSVLCISTYHDAQTPGVLKAGT